MYYAFPLYLSISDPYFMQMELEQLKQENIQLRMELFAQKAVCQKLKHEREQIYLTFEDAEEQIRCVNVLSMNVLIIMCKESCLSYRCGCLIPFVS